MEYSRNHAEDLRLLGNVQCIEILRYMEDFFFLRQTLLDYKRKKSGIAHKMYMERFGKVFSSFLLKCGLYICKSIPHFYYRKYLSTNVSYVALKR